MIVNPNKPNILQWDSPEDKGTYCTGTADHTEIIWALLSSPKVGLRSLLKLSHGAQAALSCVHGQAEQAAFNCNVTNTYKKVQASPPVKFLTPDVPQQLPLL